MFKLQNPIWSFSFLQFALTAPTGMIAAKSFQEMFADLMTLTHGAETVPDAWLNVNGDKVDNTLKFIHTERFYFQTCSSEI